MRHHKSVYKSLFLFVTISFLFTCIQGPWEYTAEDPDIFRGITVNAYLIKDKPITEVYFEKLIPITETADYTRAFYDSATVTITGDGGNGEETVSLSPDSENPSRFTGPSSFIPQAGELYQLQARITWDSSGESVTTDISGEAKIPQQFSITDSAKANSAVLIGQTPTVDTSLGIGGLAGILSGLPQTVTEELLALYQPEFSSIVNDSAALAEYLVNNQGRIIKSIDSLLSLESSLVSYYRGDTINYLTGNLNLTSHFFEAVYSDDVAGILVSHRFEEDALLPETRFDLLTATFRELEPIDFYFRGTIRRLQYFSKLTDSDSGYNIFEAIPVNNAIYKGGKNVLYFYGADENYGPFVETYINQHSSSKVTYKSTVEGAYGFFTGMIVDSFILYIDIPEGVLTFTNFSARADFCSDEEWSDSDCREFEQEYCTMVLFNDMQYAFDNPDSIPVPENSNDCLAEAVAYYLEEGKSVFYYQDSVLINGNTLEYQFRNENGSVENKSTVFTEEQLGEARIEGLALFCERTDSIGGICGD